MRQIYDLCSGSDPFYEHLCGFNDLLLRGSDGNDGALL